MDKFNTLSRPIIWSLAGSDCSGGAGIQADIKTAHAIGVELCALITANTVQNAQRLEALNAVDTAILEAQWSCLLTDKPPQAIKIGLLVNNAQLEWLSQKLSEIRALSPALPIIWDPVIKASVGQTLQQEAIDADKLIKLLQQISILTPNRHELEWLHSFLPASTDEINPLLDMGIECVVATGGDQPNNGLSIDQVYRLEQSFSLVSKQVQTSYTHGSGCTFSTAITAFLAKGLVPMDALVEAKAFINQALQASLQQQMHEQSNEALHEQNAKSADYYGALIQSEWPPTAKYYPQVRLAHIDTATLKPFKSLPQPTLGIYPVIDSLDLLAELLKTDIRIVQLRLKNKSPAELEAQIQQAVNLCSGHPCQLIINDYWQLAIKYGANGVHLGQEDVQTLSQNELQSLQQSGLLLGLSSHGSYELLLAQSLQPSYIAIGSIFPTRTKDMSGQIQGVEYLQYLLRLKRQFPIVAIGGINVGNINQFSGLPLKSIAVVTAITQADNPQQAFADLQEQFFRNISSLQPIQE